MAKFHLPTIEEGQLKNWEEKGIFGRILERDRDASRPSFVFFEGPPTANGKPGIHHLLTRAFKDAVLRYRTMQGYRIDRKAGWDTHGLPVELEVEKQLGFTKKQDIENYGIAAFNAKCRESVWTYLDLWQKSTKRIGFWVDMDDPYVTYMNDYVESLWWIISQIDKKGLLYQGFRVTPHCPRCVTSLSSHELAQGYKDTEDPSVFVKFPVAGRDDTFFLVWTTTPWTLPANVALAVGGDVTYVEARNAATGETLILAKDLVSALEGEYALGAEKKGSEIVGTGYAPLFAGMLPESEPKKDRAYKVYAADFVSTADGTGIVHIAPAFGEDDAALGKAQDLPTPFSVDAGGMVIADVPGKGQFFKKADAAIMEDLVARGLMHKHGKATHPYPFCWRCDTPVLYFAKSSWYVKMSGLRAELQERNATVNWVPGHIKDGRFGEWLKDAKDWAFSRERYWGTPLPVWKCTAQGCDSQRVIGSLSELDESAPAKNRWFLQRHGRAESNHNDTLCSWPEPMACGLTEEGRAQVVKAASELKEKGIDAIYASDLERTRQTAEIIAKELGLPVVFDARLREIDFGTLNGGAVPDFHKKAEGLDRFTQQVGDTGETLNDVRRRAVSFYKEIDAAHRGKNILVVSHGDVLWMLATAFKGLSRQEVLDWPHYNHTGQFRELESVRNLPYDELGEVDVHRPFIDDVRLACAKCGGEMRRVPDVADVWFDSGAMPYAQWHYPFQDAARIDDGRNFPAHFISEAIDQTRGWFYTLLAVATLLGKPAPYRNVICLGHVVDAKGKKMSKSKGNAMDPFVAMDKHGADALRWFFFSANQPGEPKRFDERAVEEVTKKVFLILWNVLTYWQMYAGAGAKAATAEPKPAHALDRWVLAEFAALSARVTKDMEAYDLVDASRAIADFTTDLSTWYVRRSRDRFKSGTEADKADAVATLGYVLHALSKLMAPFTPFLADELYRETGGAMDSVHLDSWPAAGMDDAALRKSMAWVRQAASAGLEKRATSGMPVRQALAKATVSTTEAQADWMAEILKDELNVLDVAWQAGEFGVELDTVLTPELKRMGAARELTRAVNDLRKTSGLTIHDRVTLKYATDSAFWQEVFATLGADIVSGTLANGAVVAEPEGEVRELEFDGEKLRFGILKV